MNDFDASGGITHQSLASRCVTALPNSTLLVQHCGEEKVLGWTPAPLTHEGLGLGQLALQGFNIVINFMVGEASR